MNSNVEYNKSSNGISYPRDISFMLDNYKDFYSTFIAIAPERFSLANFKKANFKKFGYRLQELEVEDSNFAMYSINKEREFNLTTKSDYDIESIFIFEEPKSVDIKALVDHSIKLTNNTSDGPYIERVNNYMRKSHRVDSVSLYLSNSDEYREFAQASLKKDLPKDKTLAFLVGGDEKF